MPPEITAQERAAKVKQEAEELIQARAAAVAEEKIATEVERIEKELEDKLDEFKRNLDEAESRITLPGVETARHNGRRWNFGAAVRGWVTNDWTGAEFEKEVYDQTREANPQRALSASSTGAVGSFLVPEELMEQEIVPLLRPNLVALRLGIRQLRGLEESPVRIPRLEKGVNTAWLGENAAISEDEPSFGELQMTPHMLATMVPFSERFFRLSAVAVNSMLNEMISTDMAEAIDSAIFQGLGSSNQPTGIMNTTGLSAYDAGNAMTYDDLVEVEHALMDANALTGNPQWVMHPKVFKAIRQVKDAGSGLQALERRVLADGPVNTIIGYGYEVTNNITPTVTGGGPYEYDDACLFGDFSTVLLGSWKGLELRATDEGAGTFERNQIKIRAITEVDVAVRRPEKICKFDGIAVA